jgi:hypothetical protein
VAVGSAAFSWARMRKTSRRRHCTAVGSANASGCRLNA